MRVCVPRFVTFSIIFFALNAMPAAAQFANADLEGTVTDQEGAALPGVSVTARNEASGLSRSTVTAASGSYFLNGLKPGSYTVSFALDGFQSRRFDGVPLRVGQTTRLDASLELGAIEEAITVVSEAPVVDTASKEIGASITHAEYENLPVKNRSYVAFASLLPGVVPEPSVESTSSDSLFINGQDDNNNSFNVDGSNNEDDVIGARAGAQTRTALEAVQEFQILTTQFDAEFGRSMGGVINAVTKSGGNDFEGVVFAYFQDADWDEKNFFVERAGGDNPDSSFDSLGFVLGGPILQDRLHFFVSLEDNTDQLGIVSTFPTRPELNFTTTTDNQIENLLGKLDWQLQEDHHLAFRWLRETSPQFNQIIGNVTQEGRREEDDTDSNWIISLDSVFGDHAFNNLRYSFTKEDVAFANPGFNGGGSDFASQRNQSPSLVRNTLTEGASTVAQARINRSTQIDDTFSYYLDWKGTHDLRAGFQYSEREEEFTNFGTLNGQFNFDTDVPWNRDDLSTYPNSFTIRVGGGQTAEIPGNDTLGLFVQDDWKVRETLTINLGLRYDEEDITDDANIAPRLGFAWDPFGEGRTVVRGGYGRFYDRFQLGFFANFFLDAVTVSQGFLQRVPGGGNDKDLFFQIVQDNGLTSLEQLRDFLAAQIEGGAGPVLNSAPTVDNPDRVQGYADSFSVGIEHEVWPGFSAAADLVHVQNRDQIVQVDLNPFSLSTGDRPNISVIGGQVTPLNAITTWVNAGESDYTALQLSGQKRFNGRWGGRVSYTWADSEANNFGGFAGPPAAYFQSRTESGYDFDTGRFLGEPLALGMNDPRTTDVPLNYVRDQNFVLSGQYLVPGTSWRESQGLLVSGIFRYLEGNKVTFLSEDRLDNNFRVPAAPGTYGSANAGLGFSGESFDGKLNGAENPDFASLDLSLRYRIPIAGERFQLTLLADVFNVTNRDNFAAFQQDPRSGAAPRVETSGFLVPTTALQPREYQLGVRIEF